MIELGKRQTLQVNRIKDFGIYVCEPGMDEQAVLLPKKQVPADTAVGDMIEVFIYKDSEDRVIATTGVPKLQVGDLAVLTIKEVGKIGAFLDMGLEKDLLLPYREQSRPVRQGEQVLVALYIDKSSRLAATMRVYPFLSAEAPYKKDDKVQGRIYEIKENLGAFVAVDDKYYGMIPTRELFEGFQPGDAVEARVTKVREDGKMDLSAREKAHIQIDSDSDRVLKIITEDFEGKLPFNDKVDPEIIKREFNLSKNAFKRAVGHLLKDGKVRITEKSIEIV